MKKMMKQFSAVLLLTFLVSFLTPIREQVEAKNQSYYHVKQIDQTETTITIDWSEYFEEKYSDKVIEQQELQFVEGYYFDKETEPTTIALEPDARSYTFEELKPGTEYYVKVNFTYKAIDYDYTNSTSTDGRIYTAPGKVTGLNQDKWWYWIKSCDVKWDKQRGVDGYEYIVKNHKKKTIKKNKDDFAGNGISFDVKNNMVYTIKVRAYTDLNENRIKGKWSDLAYCFTQPMINKVSYDRNGKMKIGWNKVNGCDEYTVYVSTKEKKGYKKVKTVKASTTSLTIDKVAGKKVSSNKTYFFYIVGKKKVKGKTYTSGKHYTQEVKGRGIRIRWTF